MNLIDNKEPDNNKITKERLYVKSNKSKKIELKNLDIINEFELSEEHDDMRIQIKKIKNLTFKNNVIDIEKKMIVSSVRLNKISKLGHKLTPLVWEYYKNRGNVDVNQVIKQYGKNNLIINYSIKTPIKNSNIEIE